MQKASSEIKSDDPAVNPVEGDTVGAPGFYHDQNGLIRWRISGEGTEIVASANRGFESEKDARADYDKQVANGTLGQLKRFQPQNAASGVQRDESGEPIEGVGDDVLQATGEVVPKGDEPDDDGKGSSKATSGDRKRA